MLKNNDLGCYYANGIGVVTNLEKAVKYYSLAAAQGNRDAQYSLGECYAEGAGISRNHEEAVKY